MSMERKYSLRKLHNAYGLLVGTVGEGSADIDLALYEAVTGGMYWPEFSGIWREGSSPGVWREPLCFSREEGAAIALFRFALPGFFWEMRGAVNGAYADVYPPRLEERRGGNYSRSAATAPMALCKSTIAALIDKVERAA